MDIQETGKLKKAPKRYNKKNINKDMKFDLDYYEYQRSLDNANPFNLEFLSVKEKTDFENKFSKPRNDSQWRLLNSLKKKRFKNSNCKWTCWNRENFIRNRTRN